MISIKNEQENLFEAGSNSIDIFNNSNFCIQQNLNNKRIKIIVRSNTIIFDFVVKI